MVGAVTPGAFRAQASATWAGVRPSAGKGTDGEGSQAVVKLAAWLGNPAAEQES